MALRMAILLVAIASLVAVTGASASSPTPQVKPSGRILTPGKGARLSAKITVRITLANIPASARVWLAVKRNADLWPKKPQLNVTSRSQTVTIEEGGPLNLPFSLVLVVVDPAGSRAIDSWFKNSELTGEYPALSAADIHVKYWLAEVPNLVKTH